MPLIFDTGVIQFFKKLDIGPLDIGDFLGMTFLSPFWLGITLFAVRYLTVVIFLFSAIGAIFAATDSVCTLQVSQISKVAIPLFIYLFF